LQVLAQRDDVYLVGSPRDVFTSLDILRAKASRVGLELQTSKSRAYAKQSILDSHPSPLIADFKKSSRGLIVVGTPVGTDEYVKRKLKRIVNKYPAFFRRLKLMDPQCGLLLLRECGLPMATWITRTVEPRLVGPFAKVFDERVIDAWKTLVAFEGELTDDVLTCLTLPFREGGSGLRSMEQTSPIAHYASVVGTFQTVGAVCPAVQAAKKAAKAAITSAFETLTDADIPLSEASEVEGEGREGSLAEREQTLRAAQYTAELVPTISKLKAAWNTAHTQIFKQNPSPYFPKNFLQIVVDFHPVGQKQKLQSILSHSVATKVKMGWVGSYRRAAGEAREEIDRISLRLHSDKSLSSSQKKDMKKEIERLEDTEKAARETVARIISQSDSGSSLAHTALPTTKDLALPPLACQITEKIRAGVLKLSNEKCTCKGGNRVQLGHVLGCKKCRSVVVRHDTIVRLLHDVCKRAGMVARTEWMVDDNSSNRMDLVLFPWQEWFDVTVVNPLAPTYLSAAQEVGGADEMRTEAKNLKYKQLAQEKGKKFSAAVFEATGRRGKGTVRLLNRIAEAALTRTDRDVSTEGKEKLFKGMFVREVTQHLSVAMAHCNAMVIEEAEMLAAVGKRPMQMQSRARAHATACLQVV
jgi:hypothetical protein